jgi:hypothetical protein
LEKEKRREEKRRDDPFGKFPGKRDDPFVVS